MNSMNRKQWKELGYFCMIRDWRGEHGVELSAFVHDPETGDTFVAPVDNGSWMQHGDLSQSPWQYVTDELSENNKANLAATVRDCYCGTMGGYIDCCDFCGTCRSADGAPRWEL